MQPLGKDYWVVNVNQFGKLKYLAESEKISSHIFLTLAGDSLQEVSKNDSVISYHLICKNFSIQYGKTGPVDIYMVGDEIGFGRTIDMPLDLLFLRRGNAIYFFIMLPDNYHAAIEPDLLLNIVTGR